MKHKIAKIKKNTIANRLFLPMVILVGIYAMVFWGLVWYSGVFDQLKNSEVERVRQSVTQKATGIQENLDTHWMKEENYIGLLQICKNMKVAVDSGAQEAMGVNDEVVNEIGKIIESQGVRGAYVFFESGSAYYVRKDDENQLAAEWCHVLG